MGNPELSDDRRSRRGAPDRDDLGTAMLHPPSGRGFAPRARATRNPPTYPADARRIQFRRPVSAIACPVGRRSGQQWVFVQKCLLERKRSYLTEKGLFSRKA